MDISITINGQVHSTRITNQPVIDSYEVAENKDLFIKQIIENGFAMSKCITPIINSCGCCDKIDGLTESMEIFNTGGNSSKNGQIGELLASTLFMKRNPHINYLDTAKIEKSGDAILTINNHIIGKIMIDYKNYDSSIPSDETTKLIRDMDTQNIQCGILLSYRSKISKRNYIDYEVIGDKLLVFVASYGMDILALEMAVQYIQRLHECNVLSISQQVSELVIKGIMKEITEIHEQVYKLSCHHSQDINAMKEYQDKINKMFYAMIGNGQKLLTSMKLLIDQAKQSINDIHREPITNSHTFTYLSDIIEHHIDKEKDKLYARRILNITNDLDIRGFHSETDNCIHFSDISKLQITKSKVVIIFYNKSDEICSYNPRYESTDKNNNFHIHLSDDSGKWLLIESRFTQN